MSIQSKETGPLRMLATMQHLCGVRGLIVWYGGKKKIIIIKILEAFLHLCFPSFLLSSQLIHSLYILHTSFVLTLSFLKKAFTNTNVM